ncbi:MAG: hypothetical protein OXC10_16210 [Rhodospirillaceae bacterium]|nr:hypothetical protein [Rhodospirillaceae bacterium]
MKHTPYEFRWLLLWFALMLALLWGGAAVVLVSARPAHAHMTSECATAILMHQVSVTAEFVAKHREIDHRRPSNLEALRKEMERQGRNVRRACVDRRRHSARR